MPQRTWIYLDGKTNPIVEIPIYKKEGKQLFLKPKLISSVEPMPQKPKKDRLRTLRKIGNVLKAIIVFPYNQPTPQPRTETTEIENGYYCPQCGQLCKKENTKWVSVKTATK